MQINITNGTLTQIQETLTANSGYALPNSINVSGATSNYNNSTGAITLTNLTTTMSITASGVASQINKISVGTLKLAKAFIGNSEIASMWLGNVKVYEKAGSPTPTGYNLTINGAFSDDNAPESYGSKVTIDNTTCSVDDLGNTTNIPHTFTNVTTFEIETDENICSCKIISGSGYCISEDIPNPYQYEAGDVIMDTSVGKITITMASDTIIQLGYCEINIAPPDPDDPEEPPL